MKIGDRVQITYSGGDHSLFDKTGTIVSEIIDQIATHPVWAVDVPGRGMQTLSEFWLVSVFCEDHPNYKNPCKKCNENREMK